MLLQLGNRSFDVSTRALTLLSLGANDALNETWLDGAEKPDVLEVDAACLAQAQSFDGSVVVRTSRAKVAVACLAQGAQVVHNPDGLADPAFLRVVEQADASLILSCPAGLAEVTDRVAFARERIGWAHSAGIAPERVVAVASTIEEVAPLVELATVMFDGGTGPASQGTHVMAVRSGARLISRSAADDDLRATRRTIDTVSELLKRRDSRSER